MVTLNDGKYQRNHLIFQWKVSLTCKRLVSGLWPKFCQTIAQIFCHYWSESLCSVCAKPMRGKHIKHLMNCRIIFWTISILLHFLRYLLHSHYSCHESRLALIPSFPFLLGKIPSAHTEWGCSQANNAMEHVAVRQHNYQTWQASGSWFKDISMYANLSHGSNGVPQ